MPGFTRDNTLRAGGRRRVPRVWLGNRVTVQTHYDISQQHRLRGRRTPPLHAVPARSSW